MVVLFFYLHFRHFQDIFWTQNSHFSTSILWDNKHKEVVKMYYGQQSMCRWLMANNFDEIKSAPVPMDGSQTMFMLTNEPIFYIVSFVNGQKMISGYTFAPLTAENQPKRQMTTEERLSVVEENISKIAALLEGVKKNEPDIPENATAPAGTATAKP